MNPPIVRFALSAAFVLSASLLTACGGSASPAKSAEGEPAPVAASSGTPASSPVSGDAPEISRGAGVPGGVVLLWPRVPGGTPDPESRQIAARIQKRLSVIIARALPGWPVDVRPEPERVCPRSGCHAISVGAVLLRSGNGCAAAALVSGPGTVPARIVPWAGNVQMGASSVPFRQPPEKEIAVTDFQSCNAIDGDLSQHEADVEAAIRAAGGR
jgi:hypothetical protein